jgi:Kef-type K+ transport system membrane component KefB
VSSESSTPAPLRFRHTIGWLALVTVPSAILGLAVLGGAIWLSFSRENTSLASIFAMGSLGAFTFVVFAAASGMTLDKRIDTVAGQVHDATLVFGFGRRRTLPLADFRCVHILSGTIAGAHQTHRRWKVFLVGTHSEKPISVYLTEFSERRLAEEVARDIAQHTGLPITAS